MIYSQSRRCVALVLVLVFTSGCWRTTATHCANFEGKSAFSEERPWNLTATVLFSQEFNAKEHEYLKGLEKKIESYPVQDRVRYSADLGLIAMYANDTALAKRMLDYTISCIEQVSSSGEIEKKVTSLTGKESDKIFKGEPYEKVIVFLYRGLLYLAEGDYENAQACFKNASMQDAIAENGANRANWLTVDLLELQCKKLMDGSDVEDFKKYLWDKYSLTENQLFLKEVLNQEKPRFITLVMAGPGPIKVTDGKDSQKLTYQISPSCINSVFKVDQNGESQLPETDDVYIQASTRGSRQMDKILQEKANAKKSIESVGAGAAMVAPLVPGGFVVGLLREVSWSVSGQIDSSADSRQVQSIGNKLYLDVSGQIGISGIKLYASSSKKKIFAEKYVMCSRTLGEQHPVVLIGHVPY